MQVDEFKLLTRIEVRYKPAKQKSMLKVLSNLRNLSLGIQIYSKELLTDVELPKEFADALASGKMTIPSAKSCVTGSRYQRNIKRNKIDDVLARYQVNLLGDSKEIWDNWSLCVHHLGLLGLSAYWGNKTCGMNILIT